MPAVVTRMTDAELGGLLTGLEMAFLGIGTGS